MGPRQTPPRAPLPKPRAAAAPLTPYELQREAKIATNKARLAALSIPALGAAIRDHDDDDETGGSDDRGGGVGGSGGRKRKTRGWEGGSKGARRGGALRTSTRPTLSLLLQPTSSLILVSIHSQDSSYSDLGRVLVRNDPPARRTPARHSGDDGAYGRGPTRRPLVCSTACQNPTTQL